MAGEYQPMMLSEHQGVDQVTESTNASSNYDPTEEEKQTMKMVNKLFSRAKKFRKKYDQDWVDDYNFYRGKQWKDPRPSYRHSAVFNMIFKHIQGVVPQLTDAQPKFDFLPEGPEDQDLADVLSKVAEADWKRENWLAQVTEAIFDGQFYGTGLLEVGFDQKEKQGLGSITIRSMDPLYCYPDPDSVDVNKGGCFFITAVPESVEKIKRDYPEKGEFVKPDIVDPMGERRAEANYVKFKSPVDERVTVDSNGPADSGDGSRALKITCYLKSDESYDETDESTGSVTTKLKYPKGRLICMAGGVLLDEQDLPYEDGNFPFARFVNYIDPRQFWGISEVEQLREPQKIKNKILSFMLDVLTLMGNPIWVVDDAANIDTDNLTNQPGLVVEKSAGSEVRREAGVQLQPWVFQLLNEVSTEFDAISGQSDISQGVKPEGVQAGFAIDLLQQAQQTRIRQKARNIDSMMQDAGQLYMWRVFEHYSIPRMIRITNNQNVAEYFKFHVDQRPVMVQQPVTDPMTGQAAVDPMTGQPQTQQVPTGDVQKVAVVRPYIQNSLTGQMHEAIDAKEMIVTGTFDVRVSTGSSLPFSKQERQSKALALFDRGIIDAEEVLNALDYPNKDKLIVKFHEKEAQAAAAQAAQAPPGGPGGGGGGPPPPAAAAGPPAP